MRALVARVARTLRQECLVTGRGGPDRVAVALSGGPDSVALTWLLRALSAGDGPEIAGLIHVNHQLRGAESDADEAFCRALAARLDLPVTVHRVDVAALARDRRVSIEVAARDARYAFFETAAAALDATVVATGHTLDDQAETVLMRLLRGAGTRGLSGIRVRRGRFVRPLIHCRRADLRAYLAARGETWRDDASNADAGIPRNRIRHALMPVVADMAPGAVRALGRLAALAQDDEAALMEAAIKSMPAVVLSKRGAGRAVEVDAAALSMMAPAVARRLLRALTAGVAPAAAMTARHLEAVLRLAGADKTAGHLDLPGVVVDRRGVRLTLAGIDGAGVQQTAGVAWPMRRLDVPGAVTLPEAGVVINVRAAAGEAGDWSRLARTMAVVRAAAVRLPLLVRNRRPGDRFRPLGAPGSRKLQDVLVDRKVPRSERDRVAVVVDSDDRIVWVAGVAVAHGCRVTAPGDGVLILEQRTAQ
jgi:tRNA(Ile)-lysidine synthase